MSLKQKITLIFAVGGVFPLILLGVLEYFLASNALDQVRSISGDALKERAYNQLISMREVRQTQLRGYLDNVKKQINYMSQNPLIINALNELKPEFQVANGRGKVKELLNAAGYKLIHDLYQEQLHDFITTYEFYDLFIFATNGDLIYTVVKEVDFTTNFENGPYAQTGLGKVFRQAVQGNFAIHDFETYAPSNGEPAAFVAVPIRDEGGGIIGVLGLQFSIEAISRLMAQTSGLGKTGETYLVGQDHKLRSNSRLDTELTVINSFTKDIRIQTEAVQEGLEGRRGAKLITDYRGQSVLSAYAPFKYESLSWAILAEIDESEAFESFDGMQMGAENAKRNILIYTIPIILLSIGVGIGLIFLINRITQAIIETITHLKSTSAELETVARQQATAAAEQTTSINEVSATTQELVATAKQIASNTEKVSRTAQKTAESGQQGNRAVNEAKLGMERTKDQVQLISQHMLDLGGKSQRIGMVLDIINELSEQTNLLSLNATIEAAGAGEAGQRFAVVADEVRKLAERSVASTKEIKDLVTDIQQTANTTVMVTEDGTKAVDEGVLLFNGVSQQIHDIVQQAEMNSSSAREIELTTRQQTTSVEQVSVALNDLNQTARQTEQSSNQTLETVKMLMDISNELESLV